MESSPTAPPEAQGSQDKAPIVSEDHSDAEIRSYLKEGKLPDSKPKETESAPVEEPPEGDAPNPESGTGKQPNKGKGFDARKSELSNEIQDFVSKRDRARAEYDAEAQRLADLRKPAPAAEPPKPEPRKRPRLADFVDHAQPFEAWEDATHTYYEEKAAEIGAAQVEKALAAQREATTQAERQAAVDAKVKRWNDGVLALGAPDFQQKVFDNPKLAVTDLMRDAILEFEQGPRIAYYLGQHPEESQRIAVLSPVLVVAELAKIEARLDTPAQPKGETGEPKPKKVTSAAPPPRELSGTSSTAIDEIEQAVIDAESGDPKAVSRYLRLMDEKQRKERR